MKQLIILFLLQTIILIARYYVPFPVLLGIDWDKLVANFYVNRYAQVINIVFLVAVWIHQRKRLRNMLHFTIRRMSIPAYVSILAYVCLVILFLEPFTSDILYRQGYILLVILLIGLWPYGFTQEVILNPLGFEHTALTFALTGTAGQRLPINYPQTGIFILGAAGSGKTKSVVEPMLLQLIKKGYAGILYDFKFHTEGPSDAFSLTHLAYNCIELLDTAQKKPQFFSINLQDLTTSARINPIHPAIIEDRTKLSQCIHTLLLNLSPDMAKKEDFWNKNAYALLKGIIVWLANQYPSYCTLPHAMLLGLQPSNGLMAALEADSEASMYASPILDAFKNAPEQFAGVLANFKVLLDKLLDKKAFWLLSGNDVPHVVNDQAMPAIVSLGNTPTSKTSVSPILAMVMETLLSAMYARGRTKSFLLIDELPTLILPNLSTVPATGREYQIATIVALQNMAQLTKAYTYVGAQEIKDSFSNYFVGRVPFSAAKEISDMFGKTSTETIAKTISDTQQSKTVQQKYDILMSPQDVMSLQTGEFIGRVVHKNGGFFKMRLLPLEQYGIAPNQFKPLPKRYANVDVEANFTRITKEVTAIIGS